MSDEPKKPVSGKKLMAIFAVASAVAIGGLYIYRSQFNNSAVPSAFLNGISISYTDMVAKAKKGDIARLTLQGDGKTLIASDAQGFPVAKTQRLPDDNLYERFGDNIKINVMPPPPAPEPSFWMPLITSFGPTLLVLGFAFWWIKSRQKAQGGALADFGKSKAKLQNDNTKPVYFADVAGCDEAKAEVVEVVDFLRDPKKFGRLGAQVPRGVLLVGPPGTGKTLLAKAIAGEAKTPFFSISGSDFVEMYVGVGASRVRDMYENAKKQAPCIIFIDEIDAIGRQRSNGGPGGNDERENTLNQLLVEMDGFEKDSGVIVIAATNRVDILDKALLRPGRFDRQVHVGLPDIMGREQILNVHARKVPMAADVNLNVLARQTPGMSGADLANLVNEAALFAGRLNALRVGMRHFELAVEKIFMGPERKMVMPESEIINTSYHEIGHVLTAKFMPGNDPVRKVTVIPRGGALGLTHTLPENDQYSRTYEQMFARVVMLYGGRCAEEILAKGDKNKITTGASNDLDVATEMVRNMVERYGFRDPGSDEGLATANYAADAYGRKKFGSDIQNVVESQIKKILVRAEAKAMSILKEHEVLLHSMSAALHKYETLDAKDIDKLIAGRSIDAKKETERHIASREKERAGKQSLSPGVNDNGYDGSSRDRSVEPFKLRKELHHH